MLDAISAVLMVLGAGFALLAAVGVLRFPDVFSRMHAQSKATTLGLLLLVTGAVLRIDADTGVAHLVLVVALQLLTAPVASHLVGRAAYRAKGAPPATRVDELAGAPAEGIDPPDSEP
jgi:multicomponent Na+:H+ antiporter subunit G